jgi:hypothetical protein
VIEKPTGQGGAVRRVLAQELLPRAGAVRAALLEQVGADEFPGPPLGFPPRASLLAPHELEQDVAVAPFAEGAPNPAGRPAQLPHLARAWLREERVHGLLHAPAGHPGVVNHLWIVSGKHRRYERDEPFDPLPQQPLGGSVKSGGTSPVGGR